MSNSVASGSLAALKAVNIRMCYDPSCEKSADIANTFYVNFYDVPNVIQNLTGDPLFIVKKKKRDKDADEYTITDLKGFVVAIITKRPDKLQVADKNNVELYSMLPSVAKTKHEVFIETLHGKNLPTISVLWCEPYYWHLVRVPPEAHLSLNLQQYAVVICIACIIS